MNNIQNLTLNNGNKMPILGYGVYKVAMAEIENALKLGYRHIDTAYGYFNEDDVGRALKNSGIKREDVFITTKATTGSLRERNIANEFEQSLKNLGTDYVDLYLIHWPVKEEYVSAWYELEKIYHSGKARAIGVSNYQIYHLEELKKSWSIVPAVNQIEIHPYMTQKPLIEYCQKLNIAIEAWSPLTASKSNLLEDEVLVSIAKKYNKTAAQVVLRWDIQQGIITIPRSANIGRMKSNMEIFDFALTAEEMCAIDNLNRDLRVGPNPDNFDF